VAIAEEPVVPEKMSMYRDIRFGADRYPGIPDMIRTVPVIIGLNFTFFK
jgi:hypothetical protein